jgi:hypothetical protein
MWRQWSTTHLGVRRVWVRVATSCAGKATPLACAARHTVPDAGTAGGKPATFSRWTTGIEYRHGAAWIDEIPSAYKDIDQVMADASELVEVVTTLRQVMNVKGE